MSDLSMDFNSRFYLIESVQQIVEVVGSNCVIDGLEISNMDFNSDDVLTFNLSNGKAICDSTLIQFPDDLDMLLDLGNSPSSGRLVLSLSFRYLRTSRPNFAAISLKFLDRNGFCSEWFPEKDKIVLAVIEYSKFTKSAVITESTFIDKRIVNINDLEYEIRPFNHTIQQLRPLLKQLSN